MRMCEFMCACLLHLRGGRNCWENSAKGNHTRLCNFKACNFTIISKKFCWKQQMLSKAQQEWMREKKNLAFPMKKKIIRHYSFLVIFSFFRNVNIAK